MKKRINKLELFHKDKNKIQLINYNLKNNNTIKPHKKWKKLISSFHSGIIISVFLLIYQL